MSNLEQARICAQAGAQVLDSIELFKSWRDVIDLEDFDIKDPYSCVLGQIAFDRLPDVENSDGENPFELGWNYIRREVDGYANPRQLGFDITTAIEEDITYDDLQAAWLEILREKNGD